MYIINCIVLSGGVGSSDLSYSLIFMGSFIRVDHKQVRLQFAYVPYFNGGIQTVCTGNIIR